MTMLVMSLPSAQCGVASWSYSLACAWDRCHISQLGYIVYSSTSKLGRTSLQKSQWLGHTSHHDLTGFQNFIKPVDIVVLNFTNVVVVVCFFFSQDLLNVMHICLFADERPSNPMCTSWSNLNFRSQCLSDTERRPTAARGRLLSFWMS